MQAEDGRLLVLDRPTQARHLQPQLHLHLHLLLLCLQLFDLKFLLHPLLLRHHLQLLLLCLQLLCHHPQLLCQHLPHRLRNGHPQLRAPQRAAPKGVDERVDHGLRQPRLCVCRVSGCGVLGGVGGG